jgi:hypothetical protein
MRRTHQQHRPVGVGIHAQLRHTFELRRQNIHILLTTNLTDLPPSTITSLRTLPFVAAHLPVIFIQPHRHVLYQLVGLLSAASHDIASNPETRRKLSTCDKCSVHHTPSDKTDGGTFVNEQTFLFPPFHRYLTPRFEAKLAVSQPPKLLVSLQSVQAQGFPVSLQCLRPCQETPVMQQSSPRVYIFRAQRTSTVYFKLPAV